MVALSEVGIDVWLLVLKKLFLMDLFTESTYMIRTTVLSA
jgi:hypothetical protein